MYTEADPQPPGGLTRREHAYRALKSRLIEGEFAAGERLREERLSADLDVSRTPVREALSRLQSEGFVSRTSDGYVPVVPDLPTIRELYDVRFALERWAITTPLRGGDEHDRDQLAQLRREWQELDVPGSDLDFVLLDEDFHVRLAGSAGNASLVENLVAVNERIRVVRMHDFLASERIAVTIEQHLAIVEALLAGDVAEAERRLVRNFSESLAQAEERAALTIARMLQRWRS